MHWWESETAGEEAFPNIFLHSLSSGYPLLAKFWVGILWSNPLSPFL